MIFIKPKRLVKKVFLHCSASDMPAHDDISVIKRWHVSENGWDDVGYHFFIPRNGLIQKGRALEVSPAAQFPFNRRTIAICLHGNAWFSEAQEDALYGLCGQIAEAYHGRITFHGHCEVNKAKTCPNYPYREWLNLDKNGYMALPWRRNA